MTTLIMKFGGTSVGMTMGLTQLLSIVLYEHEHWERLILVVSALDGVTDQLIEAAHLALLKNKGVIEGKRDGVEVHYSVAHPLAKKIIAMLT